MYIHVYSSVSLHKQSGPSLFRFEQNSHFYKQDAREVTYLNIEVNYILVPDIQLL